MKSNPKKKADEEEVIEYLTSVIRGKSVSEVVVKENIGKGCSEARLIKKKPDEKEKLKAAELLGKKFLVKNKNTEEKTAPEITGEEELED